MLTAKDIDSLFSWCPDCRQDYLDWIFDLLSDWRLMTVREVMDESEDMWSFMLDLLDLPEDCERFADCVVSRFQWDQLYRKLGGDFESDYLEWFGFAYTG